MSREEPLDLFFERMVEGEPISRRAVLQRMAAAGLADEYEVDVVVVGLPVSLDGQQRAAAQRALREVEMLRGCLNVPVFTYDERLTTVTAERSLDQLNMTGRNRRAVVDAVAASVILQGWLDRRAHLALTEQGSFDAERSR